MQQPVFIRLENTLEAAMNYRNSPQMVHYYFGGVQLLPNQEYPYTQITYTEGGIEIETYTVYVCDMCGNRLEDITDSFSIVRNFDDPVTGTPQLEWSLTNLPKDFMYQLVYLEIQQGINDFKYSSPFYLTEYESEFVSAVHYWNEENETVYSTGLQLWFKQVDDLQEVSTYDRVTDGNRTTVNTKLVPFEVWQTSIIEIENFRRIKQLFKNKNVYIDFVKTGLFEAFETPRLVGKENFAEKEILFTREDGNVYDPFYVPPTPPDPPVDVPFINLIDVVSTSLKRVNYFFEFGFFDPSYFTYQYSLDGVNWTDSTQGINSPTEVVVINNPTIAYFYRIYYPPLDLYSNVVQLTAPSITITNITSPQSSFNSGGNTYQIAYTINNFNPDSDLKFDAHTGDGNWQELFSPAGNQNPKSVQTPSSGNEFKFFRIRYTPYNVTSNTFNFSF